MPKQEKKEFSFISEQIKKKPFYKKKWFLKTGASIGLALVFGAVAGFVFAIVTPWAKNQFGDPDAGTRVVITQEEDTEKPTEKQTETTAVTETESETEKKEPLPETIVEKKELEVSDYKKLYSMMKTVANDSMRSVVNVSGHAAEESWFDSELVSEATGLVLAQDDSNFYIVTQKSTVTEAGKIVVTFTDGTAASGEIQAYDTITGLAVIRVAGEQLSEQALRYIRAASLGSSGSALQGSPVMLLGSRYEAGTGMYFGMVNAVGLISVPDYTYRYLETDIAGSKVPGGILINMEGQVVGILSEELKDNDTVLASALCITEIKDLLENLTNNTERAYIGIIGKDVTEEASKENDIPTGVSISSVEPESPARYSGVQPADVLTAVNETAVTSMEEYMAVLKGLKPGEVATLTLSRKGIENMYVEIPVEVTVGSAN